MKTSDTGTERRFGGPLGYGHKPSRVAVEHPHARLHPALTLLASAVLPAAVSLVDCAPAHLNQGQTGTCEGHGWAVGIYVRARRMGDALGWVPSPMGLYTPARALERAAFPEGPTEPLADDGTDSSAIIRACAQYGLRPMRALKERYSDADPATVNDEPKLADLEVADRTRIVGAYAVSGSAAERVELTRQLLAAGVPVVIEAFVDTAFENVAPGTVVDSCNLLDRNGGGHCMVILGYRTRPSGAVEFLVWNSWGSSEWGDEGSIWVSERFLATAWGLFAVDIRRAA